jgi:transposase
MKYTSLQDRVTIGELAAAGCSDQEIAEHLGWQPRTVRKWRRRLQTLGRAGLVSKMGRPAQGALSSFSEPVAATLRHWREGHPRWGPLTLRVEATQDRSLAGQRLPSRTTIARWLKAKRLTHSYQRHWDLAQSSEATAQAAHEAWEMDAYGTVSVPDVGKISLINVNDCFSHAKLLSFPCLVGDTRVERHADTADYLLVLRLTFVN